MKRTISVLACLTLMYTSQLAATDSTSTTILVEKTNTTKPDGNSASPRNSEKDEIKIIPDVSLNLSLDNKKSVLKVELSGSTDEYYEWVIFQNKGKVISRHTTSSKINEIKIDTLQQGKYVLMLKDDRGRALFKTFSKK